MEAAVQVPPRINDHKRPSIGLAISCAAVLAGATVLFLFNPSEHGFYPLCMFNRFTGLLCPGCGGLRASHELLHGNLSAAFHLNPLVVLSLPMVAIILASALWRKRENENTTSSLSPRTLWAGLVVLIVFGVLRNVPSLREAGLVF